jgi:DNA-binding XRE family transcriptional regulator
MEFDAQTGCVDFIKGLYYPPCRSRVHSVRHIFIDQKGNKMAKPRILPDKNGKPLYVLLTNDEYQALKASPKAAPKGKPGKKAAPVSKRPAGKAGKSAKNVTPIRAQRERLGLSQAEVARRLGMTQGGYAVIEKSKTPRPVTVSKVAKALGVSVARLSA